tara:strand:+ start:9481 stop:10509 length:1029 start_codon:yes stop_codon:yes gene_type:complete
MKIFDITDIEFNGVKVDSLKEFQHEKILVCEDKKCNFLSIIAIHSTETGPAIGGCRYKEYDSYEEGLKDVLLLSQSMTLKNNIVNVPFGGGKAIIFKNKTNIEFNSKLKIFAKFLNYLNGKYLSAEDIGVTLKDIHYISKYTDFVLDNVDPGPYTAKGIFYSIKHIANDFLNKDLSSTSILVQGAGSVGLNLSKYLLEHNSKVFIIDHDKNKEDKAIRLGCIKAKNIFIKNVDVLSPCATGRLLNAESIPRLKCKAIVGGANNQLSNNADADLLLKQEILYIPDFLINSGGVLGLTKDLLSKNDDVIEQDLMNIGKLVSKVIIEANDLSVHPLQYVEQNLLN